MTLELARGEKLLRVTVARENLAAILEKNGWKMVQDERLVRLDATEAEIERDLSFDKKRLIGTAFPTHYPSNERTYYPGLEVYLLDNPRQVAVGAIEDGPASRAGVHWGDVIVAVNGVDPRNKSVAELESLFTSSKPAGMTLTVDRAGVTKTFSFRLAKAATILRQNSWRMVDGKLVPLGIPTKYLACFE